MQISIDVAFSLGDTVYRADSAITVSGTVRGYKIGRNLNGEMIVSYAVMWSCTPSTVDERDWHASELTIEKPLMTPWHQMTNA
jgi:hypothetical protein